MRAGQLVLLMTEGVDMGGIAATPRARRLRAGLLVVLLALPVVLLVGAAIWLALAVQALLDVPQLAVVLAAIALAYVALSHQLRLGLRRLEEGRGPRT